MASKTNIIERIELSERDELMILVYSQLRRLANVYLQRERTNHTLQPTALVHEAYLRLIEQDDVKWQNREHFVGLAASMMRRVLVDHARGHKRGKRGGGKYKLSLTEADRFTTDENVDLTVLDEALERLTETYPQKAKIVELKFFGGLTIEETAKVLEISDTTVERDWRFARAWLQREMTNKQDTL